MARACLHLTRGIPMRKMSWTHLPVPTASSDVTVGDRPRQSERSLDASIVATQPDNDIDADDERHPLVPRTWSMLWSQIWQWKVTGPQKRTHQWFRLVLVGGGRRVVLVPQSAGTPQSIQDEFESGVADEESRAVVNHFDMTVADSDLSVEVTPRHHVGVDSTQPTRLDSPSANRFALRDDDDLFAEDSSNESERPIDHPEFVDEIQDVPSLPRSRGAGSASSRRGDSRHQGNVEEFGRGRCAARGAYKSAMCMALREAADRASA